MTILILIEQHDVLEWAIEVNGILWASGDCVDAADGERQAREELAKARIPKSATVVTHHVPKGTVS